MRRGRRQWNGKYAQPVSPGFEGSRRLDLGGQGLVGIRDCGRIDVMRPTTPPRRSPSLAPPLRTFIPPAAGTVAAHLSIRVRDVQTVQEHVGSVHLHRTAPAVVVPHRGGRDVVCDGHRCAWSVQVKLRYVSPVRSAVYCILYTHCFCCTTRARRSVRTRARWGA